MTNGKMSVALRDPRDFDLRAGGVSLKASPKDDLDNGSASDVAFGSPKRPHVANGENMCGGIIRMRPRMSRSLAEGDIQSWVVSSLQPARTG